jgi:hypothetical protein
VGRVLHSPGWDAETRFRWSAAQVLARIGPMAAEAVLAQKAAESVLSKMTLVVPDPLCDY